MSNMNRSPPNDCNGVPLKAGDMVRNTEFGEISLVEAIGTALPFAGYIMVAGFVGWVAAKRFEKVMG